MKKCNVCRRILLNHIEEVLTLARNEGIITKQDMTEDEKIAWFEKLHKQDKRKAVIL